MTPMTAAGITVAIAKLRPGQRMIYHTGSLMFDRKQEGPFSRLIHETALAAYAAYKCGEVTLVQHKIAPITFEYIAIRR